MRSSVQQEIAGSVKTEQVRSTTFCQEQSAQQSCSSHPSEGTEHSDPIAIIGLALKFPQDAVDTESFWKLLLAGRSALTKVPQERYNAAGFDVANEGHFIREDLGAFDAPFFSLSPAEAEQMDPQQRWLLETTYQALENAGITMDEIKSTQTSVHVGNFSHDFEKLTQLDTNNTERHRVTGSSMSILANRLSWFYDLHGPSVVVDTACSSSLVALHQACQSLKEGVSDMGIVAGVNLFFDPSSTADLGNIGFLSPDNKCYSFDDRANGYSRGEGVGVVLVKPLSRALKDGNAIRAIVRATGSNQDGKTPGITQPSGTAQMNLICATYRRAGLDVGLTRYFEAHGTGTAVGDPTEARAISDAFKIPDREAIYIGAVKSNIGHLEGASGIAGLIKSVLVLERGLIPPNIWFEQINAKIKPDEWGLKFPTQTMPWPCDGPRRASVNSFGFGGTNAHAILDSADDYLSSRGFTTNVRKASSAPTNGLFNDKAPEEVHQDVTRQIVILSSFDEAGIDRLTSTMLQAHMGSNELSQEHYLEDVAFTLNERRAKLPWRSFATMSDKSSLQELVWSEPVRAINDLKLCFIFTGQGAQWRRMGQDLLRFKVFRKSIECAESFLRSLGCYWSITELLFIDYTPENGYGDIDDARYSQPSCTIIQVALVDLLESWGITPAIVVGHSSGEIAAAYCSKAISQEMAWKISYYRGLAVSEAFTDRSIKTSMMAVQLSSVDIQPYLAHCSKNSSKTNVTISCFNSPDNVTVSGTLEGLSILSSALEKEGILFRKLKVPVGYHSSQMTEAAEIYRHYLQREWTCCTHKEGPLFISTVTESQTKPSDLQSADYWVSNLVKPVKFSNVMRIILNPKRQKLYSTNEIDARYIVELGPHSTLRSSIKDIMKTFNRDISKAYSSALIRQQYAMDTILNCVGELSCAGYPVNMSAVNGELGKTQKPQLVATLPPYPFNHSQIYWHESRIAKSFKFRKFGRHELLGTPVPDWNTLEPRWNNTFFVQDMKFLNHHIVNGIKLYPAAGMLVMAIEASRQLANEKAELKGFRFKDVAFSGALPLSDSTKGTETQLVLRPTKESVGNTHRKWDEFRLCVWVNGSWLECCRGAITTEYASKSWSLSGADEHDGNTTASKADVEKIRKNCRLLLATKKDIYSALEKMGLTYGPTFQGLENIRVDNKGSATGSVDLSHWKTVDPQSKCKAHLIHPAALDAILQLAFPALAGVEDLEGFPTAVPTRLRSLWISSRIADDDKHSVVDVCATSRKTGLRDFQASFTATSKSTDRIDLTIDVGLTVVDRTVSNRSPERDPNRRYYRVFWHPDAGFIKSPDQLDLNITNCRNVCVTSEVKAASYTKKEWLCLSTMTTVLNTLPATYEAPKAHIQRYIDWMRHILSMIENDFSQYALVKKSSDDDPSRFHDSVKNGDAEGFILAKMTKSLPKILSGELDSLQFLFSDDSLQSLYNQDWATGLREQVRAYARAVGHKTPGLKILEVGAGTGGLTTVVLEGLGAYPDNKCGNSYLAEYAYTDISPSFFMRAKKQFGEVNIKYQTLDIAAKLGDQGFQEGYYDLLVASNVLHATPELKVTLDNCRRLLKPGGKMILHENMNPDRITSGMIFGLLPGWWLSTEENRRWSPLLSRADWNAALLRAGFSGEEILLEGTDQRNLDTSPNAVMISTAVSQVQLGAEARQSAPWTMVIYDESSEAQNALRKEIERQYEASKFHHKLTCCSLQDTPILEFSHANVVMLPSLESLYLHLITSDELILLQNICSRAKSILWLGRHLSPTGSPDNSMATGMGRAIESEDIDLSFITLTVEPSSTPSRIAKFIWYIISQSSSRNSPWYENEYAERSGVLYIPRIVEDTAITSRVYEIASSDTSTAQITRRIQHNDSSTVLQLGLSSVGLLDTFIFSEVPTCATPLALSEVELQVLAVGLNFVDVLTALGQVSRDYIGNELAGIVTAVPACPSHNLSVGDVVIGCHNGTMATKLRCKAWQLHLIPPNMSVTDAATLPLVYCTVYYGLVTWARAQPGESVLIHSGAGGVGQAAIQLARVLGLTIYTTTSSDEKAKLLMETYDIPSEYIFNSRALDFTDGIRRLTGGRGVDIVLNSLSGEALRESFDLLAPFGRFLELGKRDVHATGTSALGGLPMYTFSRNVMFASVDLPSLYLQGDRISEILSAVVDLAAEGKIKAPAPVQVFTADKTEQAFRAMQGGKNVGKIVIDYSVDVEVKAKRIEKDRLFNVDTSYVIAGGMGGIARSIAKWMVRKGAKNLVLLSRSAPKGPEAEAYFQHLEAYGAKAVHHMCDVADAERLKAVLNVVQSTMPPIKGCIQAAMVLENYSFTNMTLPHWNAALRPKVAGTWNLHKLLPQSLSFFITLSSHSGILGAHGQSNYAAGNAFQDELARQRVITGEPAVAIDLGRVLTVGYVAENDDVNHSVLNLAIEDVSEREILALLEHYCALEAPLLQADAAQVITPLALPAMLRARGAAEPAWLSKPMLRHLHHVPVIIAHTSESGASAKQSWEALLRGETSWTEAEDTVCKAICEHLADLLAIGADDVDSRKPVHLYGVDSLVAVELRNWFLKSIGADVPVLELLGSSSILELAKRVVRKSSFITI